MTRADALHGVPEEFVHRTRETVVAAHNRYRRQRGWGALTSPPLPAAALDELAVAFAAVAWDAAQTAMDEFATALTRETTRLSRPGLCGNVPPRLVPSCQPQTSCTLRAGHAGFHEDDSGASWGQTWNEDNA